MTHPWDAEHIIDPEKARHLIAVQFPELKPRTITLFGAGWDNTAYLINNEYIFRFPRREIAVGLIKHEIAALPRLVGKLPIAIPNPEWHGKPTDEYPWPFLGYRLLSGHTACGADLSDEQRATFVDPLALFLKTLHHIPIKEFESILPGDSIDRLTVTVRIPKIIALIKDLESLGLLPHKKILFDIIENCQGLSVGHEKVICHGDLYVRHFLIDDNNQLTGIIDWGDIHLNSPAVDLSVVYIFFPPHLHERFQKIYGPISLETGKLAQFRALNHSLNLINFGHKSGDLDLEREGRKGVEYIAASFKL